MGPEKPSCGFESLASYSQFGEDVVAYHLLAPLRERADAYLDVGSGHPVQFNNTHLLSRLGWRGLSVDPCPDLAPLYRTLRPTEAFLNAAVGTPGGMLAYHRFSLYLYSTCDAARAECLKQQPGIEFIETLDVPCVPLEELFERHCEGRVDFLSIDVEGVELDVLSSNDWERHRPAVLAVEIMGLTLAGGVFRTAAFRLLESQHYAMKAVTESTFFFVDTHRQEYASHPELPFGEEGQR